MTVEPQPPVASVVDTTSSAPPAASTLAAKPAAPAVEVPTADEPPLPTQHAPRLAELQRRIQAVDDYESEAIPAAAQPLLVDLRETSVALVQSVVTDLAATCGPRLTRCRDQQIEQAIEQRAAAAGVQITPRGGAEWRNALWSPSATRSKVNPRYLVIGFYYAVPCGSDGGYLVYDLGSAPARLLLTLTSPAADTIEPMFWQLAFALPPPGNPQDFFFVAARINPWCQSAQRQMQLLVLKPTAKPREPAVLVDLTVGQHLQKPHRLDVNRDSILLETDDGLNQETHRWVVQKGKAKLVHQKTAPSATQ